MIQNIMMTIQFTYVQQINRRIQITQERSESELMTNYVKFMQQTSLPLSEDYSSVCN